METAPFSSPTTLPFRLPLPFFPPSSSAEPTEEAPPEVQLPAVIPQAGGDDLLIGDLLSLDLPTGPSTAYNAPSGACVYLLTNLFAMNRLCCWYIVSVCVFCSGGLEDLDFLTGELGGLQVSIMDALVCYRLL